MIKLSTEFDGWVVEKFGSLVRYFDKDTFVPPNGIDSCTNKRKRCRLQSGW
jgi:hypothetical protein